VVVESCMPVIPRANLEKGLRLWVDGLGFEMDTEMRAEGRLIFCMLHKGDLCFMLNQRAGTPVKPENYEGIRLYWNGRVIHVDLRDVIPLATGAEAEDNAVKNPTRISARQCYRICVTLH
jgi:hypothetical protein